MRSVVCHYLSISNSWTVLFSGIIGTIPNSGSYPSRALNGVQPNDEWYEVLYENSARGNHDFHFFGVLWTLQRRNISRHWLTVLVWPSVWGWVVVLISKDVWFSLKRCLYGLPVKILSWSETMDLNIPCKWTTDSSTDWAICLSLIGCVKRMKCAYFENLSTTTNTVLDPLDLGKRSTKSIEISCEAPTGTGSGWSNLAGWILSGLACWHVLHCCTKFVTSDLSPFQHDNFLILR
jgi:hypothetical protein